MNMKSIFLVLKKIDAVYAHYDRVRIWADTDISFLDCDKLTNKKGNSTPAKIFYTPEGMKFHSGYKNYIDLFQPSKQNLKYLINSLLTVPANFIVNNVEITYDFTAPAPEKIAAIVNQYLVQPRREHTYFKQIEDSTMHYWGVIGQHDFFAASYLRDSKIIHVPCFHLEWKLKSKDTCATHGLVTPFDLPRLNFETFFNQNAQFYLQPKKHIVGRALALKKHKAFSTNRSYENFFDANADIEIAEIDKVPVQLLLTKVPTLNGVLKLKKYNKHNISFTNSMQEALLRNLKVYC